MVEEYLNRLGIYEKLDISFDSLCKIQQNHLLNVPFENFNIHLYKELKLEKDFIFDKIVNKKRGGLCYEMNYLLYLILVKMGFDAELIGSKTKNDGNFFDHPLIKVFLDNNYYLVDVGFGDNFMKPIKLSKNTIHTDTKGTFKISFVEGNEYILEKLTNDIFVKQFIIRDKEEKIEDFYNRKEWYVNSDQSIFRKNFFCSKEYLDGRVSLKENKIKYTRDGKVFIEAINNEDSFLNHLVGIFGIHLLNNEILIIKEILKEFYGQE